MPPAEAGATLQDELERLRQERAKLSEELDVLRALLETAEDPDEETESAVQENEDPDEETEDSANLVPSGWITRTSDGLSTKGGKKDKGKKDKGKKGRDRARPRRIPGLAEELDAVERVDEPEGQPKLSSNRYDNSTFCSGVVFCENQGINPDGFMKRFRLRQGILAGGGVHYQYLVIRIVSDLVPYHFVDFRQLPD